MTFNVHGNVTADGVVITEGLAVFTNEMRVTRVSVDRDRMCCLHDEAGGQMRVEGFWFSNHSVTCTLTGVRPGCAHDHWFDMREGPMMNGERIATRFEGRAAEDEVSD